MARIGLSRLRSGIGMPSSINWRTSSVLATFSSVVACDMFESPTMTCNRRNRSASACGSSRVLMIGLDRVVAEETPSQMCSARWLSMNVVPRGELRTLPAPQSSWRVTRNGSSTCVTLAKSECRVSR